MTTFTLSNIGSVEDHSGGTVAFSFGASVAGNIVVIGLGRPGGTHADHAVSDDNGGSWTKIAGIDHSNSETFATSFWWRELDSGDNSTSGDITGETSFGNSAIMHAFMVEPSASYTWTLEEIATHSGDRYDLDTEAASTSSISGSDLLELAYFIGQPRSGGGTTMSFDNHTDSPLDRSGSWERPQYHAACKSSGQSGGVKTADFNESPEKNNGAFAMIVFSGGGGGGGGGSLVAPQPHNSNNWRNQNGIFRRR